MSVLTAENNSNRNSNAGNKRQPSEFDGFFLNPGLTMKDKDTGEERFVKLNRGIFVSDLQPRKVYDTTPPEMAAEIIMINNVISAIQARCKTLEPGGSIKMNFEMELYRKMDEADQVADIQDLATVDAALFG